MLLVFGAAVYFLVADNLAKFLALPLNSLVSGVSMVGDSIEALLWQASWLFLTSASQI